MADPVETLARSGGNLVIQVREALRDRILGGGFAAGDRLPSEAELTREYGVSRTVIREAVAGLRADRLVEPRQGAGVFVLEPPRDEPGFGRIDPARVSSLLEMLELRTAVEGDAAALAALRRAPAQEEAILEAFRRFRTLASEGAPTAEADFTLHLAIAAATNNPRFSEFLRLAGASLIPRQAASTHAEAPIDPAYASRLVDEHQAVVYAIRAGDDAGARTAMRWHLENSQARYRHFLRQQEV